MFMGKRRHKIAQFVMSVYQIKVIKKYMLDQFMRKRSHTIAQFVITKRKFEKAYCFCSQKCSICGYCCYKKENLKIHVETVQDN